MPTGAAQVHEPSLLDCDETHMRNVGSPDRVIQSVRRDDRPALVLAATRRSLSASAWLVPRYGKAARKRGHMPAHGDNAWSCQTAAGHYWRREP